MISINFATNIKLYQRGIYSPLSIGATTVDKRLVERRRLQLV